MPYSIIKCHFTTSLHVAQERSGGALDTGAFTVRSDTLFSALCHEAARAGQLEALYQAAAQERLLLSDMLPFTGDTLWLPRPMLPRQGARSGRYDPSAAKALKRLSMLPLDGFQAYLDGLTAEDLASARFHPFFGQAHSAVRAGILGNEQTLPYRVGQFRFAGGAGLYTVVKADDPRPVTRLMHSLGLSGLGGKRTSGLGRFEVETMPCPGALLTALDDGEAPWQMLLSTALPDDDALAQAMDGAYYRLVRRGGFVASSSFSGGDVKKRTLYMFERGSAFRRRFSGRVHTVAQGSHPVWRLGTGLFMGVRA